MLEMRIGKQIKPIQQADFVAPSRAAQLDRILTDLAALEQTDDEAAMVVFAPDMGEYIRANSAGFQKLAVASLRAAKGDPQRFDTEEWIVHEDADWWIAGLQPDPLAASHLPTPQSGKPGIVVKLIGYSVLGGILLCLIVGIVTILHFIGALL